MAIELTDDLIQLQRASLAAQAEALQQPYTWDGWKLWREAATAFQLAVTAHAEAHPDQGRYELEMAAKKAARTGDGSPLVS